MSEKPKFHLQINYDLETKMFKWSMGELGGSSIHITLTPAQFITVTEYIEMVRESFVEAQKKGQV